jgi:hypothetical protein
MVRFRPAAASTQPLHGGALGGFGDMTLSDSDDDEDKDQIHGLPAYSSASERRRLHRIRRTRRKKTAAIGEDSIDGLPQAKPTRKKKEKKPKEALYDDELDPYDSDPGESYRQHCMKIQGMNTKSCLKVPKFLLKNDLAERKTFETRSTSTAPPSPLSSELEQTPESLENNSRVRYSLRTSIGDGSAKQPTGPSVMERRELRPNNVAVNVSHWSDCGARPYMEDR